jgi:hypothetical protein
MGGFVCAAPHVCRLFVCYVALTCILDVHATFHIGLPLDF